MNRIKQYQQETLREYRNIGMFIILLSVILVILMFSGCASPEKETNVGNQEMKISGSASQSGQPGTYIQAVVVVAPGSTTGITSSNNQRSDPDLDGNLGYNGQASSGSGAQQGTWEWLINRLKDSGIVPEDDVGPVEPKEDPVVEEESEDPVEYGKLTRFQEYRHGTRQANDDILMCCPGEDIYKDCWLNGDKMSEKSDKDRRMFWIKGDNKTAEIVCELESGGFVKADLKYGRKGEC